VRRQREHEKKVRIVGAIYNLDSGRVELTGEA
jgi:carbonic anhydrase